MLNNHSISGNISPASYLNTRPAVFTDAQIEEVMRSLLGLAIDV